MATMRYRIAAITLIVLSLLVILLSEPFIGLVACQRPLYRTLSLYGAPIVRYPVICALEALWPPVWYGVVGVAAGVAWLVLRRHSTV